MLPYFCKASKGSIEVEGQHVDVPLIPEVLDQGVHLDKALEEDFLDAPHVADHMLRYNVY